jgi:hypothetical protein
MAAPPSIRSLNVEDFSDLEPDQLRLAKRLIEPINGLLTGNATALNRGLTLGDNLSAQVKSLDVQAPSPWVGLTLAAGWVAFSPTYGTGFETHGARKDGDRCRLRGALKYTGAGSLPLAVATLPSGYGALEEAILTTSGNDAYARVDVTPAGALTLVSGSGSSYLSLGGLSYPALDGSPAVLSPFPLKFACSVKPRPRLVWLASVVDKASPTSPPPVVGLPSCTWDGQNVVVHAVPGLTSGRNYTLTFVALAG